MLPVLAINLDRSVDRWDRLCASASSSGLTLQRVPAVEGVLVAASDRRDLDAASFRRYHGRTVLDGEYGCYRSHVAALQTVIDMKMPLAIIAEDDVGFSSGLDERVASIFAASPAVELLKLVNHRTSGFVRHGKSALGDEFGRCMHGPQGSAACYAVSQKGAATLVKALQTMWLPYDIAFERGWATGAGTFTTRTPLVTLLGHGIPTTIATQDQYRATKRPKTRQVATGLFRGADYLARMIYAMKGR